MNEILKKKQRARLAYLNKLYELTNGSAGEPVNGAEVAFQIGFNNGDEEQLSQVAKYLEGEGLIRTQWLHRLPASVSLTHKGLREIEDAISKPDEPTQYFMSINVLNVEKMVNSTVQQGTIKSIQDIKTNNK